MYLNALFAAAIVGFLYRRLLMGMTFDRSIHKLLYVSESLLFVMFLMAFICDLIETNIDTIFTFVFLISLAGTTFLIT